MSSNLHNYIPWIRTATRFTSRYHTHTNDATEISRLNVMVLIIYGTLLSNFVAVATSANEYFYNFLNSLFENIIVPAYTLSVIIYLTGLYLDVDLLGRFGFSPASNNGSIKWINSKVSRGNDDDRNLDKGSTITVTSHPEPTSAINEQENVIIEKEQNEIPYESEDKNAYMPVNLTGVYQLRLNHNVDAFLEAQGVPWALRRAALSAKPIHRITHQGNSLTIRIEAVGFKTQTSFVINGPPVETEVRGRVFDDRFTYLKEEVGEDGIIKCRGVIVTKTCRDENYYVTAIRELSDDGQKITLTSTAYFPDKNKAPVVGQQIFDRIT